ncbi:MAG: hypothetical protein NTY35_06350 [Planctomycetota bacterium]|nr:hypothetical protein [Planctomycetota bacterium]
MSTTHTEILAGQRPGVLAWIGVAVLFAVTSAITLAAAGRGEPSQRSGPVRRESPPRRLADTGLYGDAATRTIASDVLPFTPQYPLWTDGAEKQRWIRLPPGESIDASNPDVWRFPVGTQLWKEFSFGRRVESRTMELGADGRWTYATYAWTEDGNDAVLAPEGGVRGACSTGRGTRHDIPGVADCRVCHEGGPNAVLGFSALQLSADRDPLAPHAERPTAGSVDLDDLVARGLVRGLPRELTVHPPRIEATSPRERAALGYLHGNCGSCHNAEGPLSTIGLELDYPLVGAERRAAPAMRTALGRESRFQPTGLAGLARIEAGDPDRSTLVARLSSRSPVAAMPPLGTRAVDEDAVALVREWIASDFGVTHPSGAATTRLEIPKKK